MSSRREEIKMFMHKQLTAMVADALHDLMEHTYYELDLDEHEVDYMRGVKIRVQVFNGEGGQYEQTFKNDRFRIDL